MSNDGTFNCKTKIFDRKIDTCRLVASLSTTPIVSLVLDAIQHHMNVKFDCPAPPRLVVIENLSIPGILPFPSGSKFCVIIMYIVKTNKNRNFQNCVTFKINATYIFK